MLDRFRCMGHSGGYFAEIWEEFQGLPILKPVIDTLSGQISEHFRDRFTRPVHFLVWGD
jgi:hypothetical protein